MIQLISNLRMGHAHDPIVKTGVTVILPDQPSLASVDVRGGGPGTREISALQDGGLIDHVHAITLSGGSVYGLGAADAVTAWLGQKGIGYPAGPAPIPVSPIVPSAILFDNANGGNKDWGDTPPFQILAIEACKSASDKTAEGAVGAGHGATAGLYTGGLGVATEQLGEISVQAIIAANPVGSPFLPKTKCPWAWKYERDGEFGQIKPPQDYVWSEPEDTKLNFLRQAGQSTVIGAVITDAALSRKQLKRLAIMAQDGLAMSVQPSHTPLDGDTIFSLSVGDKTCDTPVMLADLGAAAARATARALTRGVLAAQ